MYTSLIGFWMERCYLAETYIEKIWTQFEQGLTIPCEVNQGFNEKSVLGWGGGTLMLER
jgi:hypothetical protein